MITANNINTLNPSQARRIPRYGADLLKTVFPPVEKKSKTKTSKPKQLTALVASAPASLNPDLRPVCQSISQRHPELWGGNWQHASARGSGRPFESQSQADLALAGHIARECSALGHLKIDLFDAVEQVFSQSGLALREKWLDRPDYRTATIGRAIDGCVANRDTV